MIPIASRPRTLVLLIAANHLDAAMLDPIGAPIGDRLHVPRTADAPMPDALHALWPQLEPLGEFDRISVAIDDTVGETWAAPLVITELERQSLRPVRAIAAGELRWGRVIRRTGVELALGLGDEVSSTLFADGTWIPGLALGRHRFRKGLTYSEYVAPRVLERKGEKTWNRRVDRVVSEVLAVWNPTTLYVGGALAAHVTRELPANVVVVREPPPLAAALELWTAPKR
ncbi:MAG: hypothetical protein H0T89_27225 [Deltaproteobacteria bacterium]|nr:hypothetical protein [Deltaproteobacteria bacterium]MDQ3298338.1 hypothetical protein [Myxococcota bacterium]